MGFEPYQVQDEIYRACPPEVRIEQVFSIPHDSREVRFNRIDPESRTARYILESRLDQLLETYPSVSHVYLWGDEFMNWASQGTAVELPVTPFKQAHDFLRRHAPDKRLVLAGWGGIARNFEHFHRSLPDDVIFAALSDQLGWDPVHEAFSKLENRERWPILWIEDDPSMWFPQVHVSRFARDLALTEQYNCQGILGIHWRHRLIDPVAGYLSRRCWDDNLSPEAHYTRYARTQASGERADDLAAILHDVDVNRKFLSAWTGEWRDDGHAKHQEWAGDYNEAFTIELHALLLRQRGGDYFNEKGEVTLDSDLSVNTAEWILKQMDAGLFAQVADNNFNAADWAAYKEGKFIGAVGADWYAGFLKDNVPDLSGKWKAAPLPAWEKGGARTSVYGGTGATIIASGKHVEECWKFLECTMLNKDANARRFKLTTLFPPLYAAMDDPRLHAKDAYFSNQDLDALFKSVADKTPVQYQSPFRTKLNALRDAAWQDILDKKKTPKQAFTEIADTIRAEMKAG